MARDTELKSTEEQGYGPREASVCPKRTQGRAIYVHLCNGEVKVIPDASVVSLERDLLCVCGDNCQSRQYFPRKDVYFCSRIRDVPAPPLC